METKETTRKKGLVKKFHVLLGQLNGDRDAKEAILESYGVRHTTELNIGQLTNICVTLEEQVGKYTLTGNSHMELDPHRKRLIAAIFGWSKAMNLGLDMDRVKGVACRAAKCEKFNDIPKQQLISLYNAFRKMVKDLNSVTEVTLEMLDYLKLCN